MVSFGLGQLTPTTTTTTTPATAATAAAVESYHRIPRFRSAAVAALLRRLPPESTTTTTTTGSSGLTAPPPNVVTAILLATESDPAILDSFAHAGTPDRTGPGPARGANGGPNITTTDSPMEEDQPKLILYIVLPVCLAVIAFVLVAVAVRCIRRRKAANQARNETPDLWIRNSQELPLYAVDCTLPNSTPEVPISPKTDLSTICEVLQTYVPQSPRELQLVKGEFLKIVEKDPKGWCRGVIGTHIGWFPGSFVKEIRTASLIEASDDEVDEEETTPPERLKPRVSSFMIKKRVIKLDENGQLPNDDDSRILSRSHSEFGDIISLPRSRASTAGSSIFDDPDYVRFQQRSPACRLSIPDRFRNGSLDLRMGPPLLNNADNPYPISRRMYPRRSEPISLLLQVPASARPNPPRPTRPAPPPPPSRKSAVITSTVAPSTAIPTPTETSSVVSAATSHSSVATSDAALTSTTTATATIPTPVTQISQAPAQLEVADPVPVPTPAPVTTPVPATVPVPASVTVPATVPVPAPVTATVPVAAPVVAPTPVVVPAPVSTPASASGHTPLVISAPIPIQIPLTNQTLIPVQNPEAELAKPPAQIIAPTPDPEPIPVPPPIQEPIASPASVESLVSDQNSVNSSIQNQDQTSESIPNETPVSEPIPIPAAQSPIPPQAPIVMKPEPLAQIVLRTPKCPVSLPQNNQAEQSATEPSVIKQKIPPPTQPKPPPPAVQPKPVLKSQLKSLAQSQSQIQLIKQPEPELQQQQHTQQVQE